MRSSVKVAAGLIAASTLALAWLIATTPGGEAQQQNCWCGIDSCHGTLDITPLPPTPPTCATPTSREVVAKGWGVFTCTSGQYQPITYTV